MEKIITPGSPGRTMGLLLALALSVFFSFLARADDDNLLVNGDFSRGADGWAGDATVDDAGHVAVHLSPDMATRIYQSFEARDPSLTLSITWTPSSDVQFTGEGKVAKIAEDVEESASQTIQVGNVLETLTNPNYPVYMSSFNHPVLLVVDREGNQVFRYPLKLVLNGAQQTATVSFPVQTHKDYRLYIAFPPGQGSVVFTNVSLTPSTVTNGSAFPTSSRSPFAPQPNTP